MEFLDRVRAILFAPGAAWPAIAREKTAAGSLVLYVAVLATIPALARFIGVAAIGMSTSDGAVVRTPPPVALLGAVAEYAFAFIAVAVVALVTNVLAPWFGAQRNLQNALELSVHSFTPYWLAGIFNLFPGLTFLAALGLYGFYLAWAGLPHLMRSPSDRSLGYAAAILVTAIAVIILALELPDILLVRPRIV